MSGFIFLIFSIGTKGIPRGYLLMKGFGREGYLVTFLSESVYPGNDGARMYTLWPSFLRASAVELI